MRPSKTTQASTSNAKWWGGCVERGLKSWMGVWSFCAILFSFFSRGVRCGWREPFSTAPCSRWSSYFWVTQKLRLLHILIRRTTEYWVSSSLLFPWKKVTTQVCQTRKKLLAVCFCFCSCFSTWMVADRNFSASFAAQETWNPKLYTHLVLLCLALVVVQSAAENSQSNQTRFYCQTDDWHSGDIQWTNRTKRPGCKLHNDPFSFGASVPFFVPVFVFVLLFFFDSAKQEERLNFASRVGAAERQQPFTLVLCSIWRRINLRSQPGHAILEASKAKPARYLRSLS